MNLSLTAHALQRVYEDDHKRGCQGSEYICTCGFDDFVIHTAMDAAVTIGLLTDALVEARSTFEGLSYIHDDNPSLALADAPAVEYARHMLGECRKEARNAKKEIDLVLAGVRAK